MIYPIRTSADSDGSPLHQGDFKGPRGHENPTRMSMEVIVTILSKLVYFTYLWDL